MNGADAPAGVFAGEDGELGAGEADRGAVEDAVVVRGRDRPRRVVLERDAPRSALAGDLFLEADVGGQVVLLVLVARLEASALDELRVFRDERHCGRRVGRSHRAVEGFQRGADVGFVLLGVLPPCTRGEGEHHEGDGYVERMSWRASHRRGRQDRRNHSVADYRRSSLTRGGRSSYWSRKRTRFT